MYLVMYLVIIHGLSPSEAMTKVQSALRSQRDLVLDRFACLGPIILEVYESFPERNILRK